MSQFASNSIKYCSLVALSKGYTVCRKSAHAYKRSTNVPRDQANTVPRRSFVLDPKRIIVGNVTL